MPSEGKADQLKNHFIKKLKMIKKPFPKKSIHYTPDLSLFLGSGLIGERIPPLFATKKTADLYLKYDKKPLIITSGGQGN